MESEFRIGLLLCVFTRKIYKILVSLGTVYATGYSDVLCPSLEDGKRCQVGSCDLTPERHMIEYVFTTLIVSLTLYFLLPILPHPISHNNVVTTEVVEDPYFWKHDDCLNLNLMDFNPKFFCMAMPCNILWLLFSLDMPWFMYPSLADLAASNL